MAAILSRPQLFLIRVELRVWPVFADGLERFVHFTSADTFWGKFGFSEWLVFRSGSIKMASLEDVYVVHLDRHMDSNYSYLLVLDL